MTFSVTDGKLVIAFNSEGSIELSPSMEKTWGVCPSPAHSRPQPARGPKLSLFPSLRVATLP